MDKIHYEENFSEPISPIMENRRNIWKPLLRQTMICTGVWCIYVMQGLCLGAPTVLKEQLRREENTIITDDMSSWLSSMSVISAVPSVFILPYFFYQKGRKITFLIVCVLSSIGFIIFYNSRNVYHILISQVFMGTINAAVNTFVPVIVAEYTSPKYRGIFLTFKSASTFWGFWISNAIGTFFHWKNIAYFAFLCSAYTATVIVWPESPYWLATKGRYAEAAKSHRWLKGVNENSEKELATLISSQKNSINMASSKDIKHSRYLSCYSSAWSTITTRHFYKPAAISIVLFAQNQLSGKYVISIYAIEVLKGLTQDVSTAYKGMLILDGVTVFSMYVGCLLSRYLKRKTLMLLFAIIGISFLYILSFYMYLISISVVQENHVMIIFILTMYSIGVSCGPMILATSIYGEIIPSCYQYPIMIIVGFYQLTVSSAFLKLSPFMSRSLGIPGYFLFFAISSSLVLIVLLINLPETKDKTVYEIEEHFAENHLSVKQNVLLKSCNQ